MAEETISLQIPGGSSCGTHAVNNALVCISAPQTCFLTISLPSLLFFLVTGESSTQTFIWTSVAWDPSQ